MTAAPNPARRSARSRQAALDATIELIARDGYANVTVEAIAAAARVSKATIYRWWPAKGQLALDAINDRVGGSLALPDTGDIAADLRTQMTEVIRVLNSDIGTVYRGLIGEAQSNAVIGAAIRDSIIDPQTEACETRLAKAVADGQLRADVPTGLMVDLLIAPLHYRMLLGTQELRPEDLSELIDCCLSGLRAQGGDAGAPTAGS
jgi:AcrR family transcriptional regulator